MTGAASATAAVANVASTASRIARTMEPYFKVENQDLRIDAPDRTGSLRVFATVKNDWRKPFARPIRFDHPEVYRFEATSLPMGRSEAAAVRATGDGYVLDPAKLSDCDALLLAFHFSIENPRFVDALVKTTTKHDVADDQDSYWITAQLRHPAALRAKNYSVELRDVDFNVDVAVHQDIKEVIPKPFQRDLETISQWIREHDRGRKFKLTMQHLRQAGVGLAGRTVEIMERVQVAFVPSNFRKYVSVEQMFRLAEVRRGMEFYDWIPSRTFPRAMTVVSRTDLNLETCAADGLVTYHKTDFREALAELFPRAYRPTVRGREAPPAVSR